MQPGLLCAWVLFTVASRAVSGQGQAGDQGKVLPPEGAGHSPGNGHSPRAARAPGALRDAQVGLLGCLCRDRGWTG